MPPSISVIMTVYNGGAYLKDAIESILSQTFKDFEFIIINDGSTDSSEEIIRSFSHSRIVYICNRSNIGQTRSLNKAIDVAGGRYIARMDADDISFPGRFAEQYNYLENNSRVAVVGTWHQEIDANGRLIRKCLFPKSPVIKARLAFSKLVGWPIISHPSVMIRKETLDEVGYYDPDFDICQDYDLWVRIARKYPIENIPKILMGYRVHNASLTKKFKGRTNVEYKSIILRNVEYYMGQIDPIKKNRLFNMLCNDPQSKDSDIECLFADFDSYFSQILSEELSGSDADKYRNLNHVLKVFYIPQLIKTHRKYAGQLLIKSLFRYPFALLSKRFAWSIRNSLA